MDELKALAEKATAGDWELGKGFGDQSRHIYGMNPVNDGEDQWLPLIASTDDGEHLVNFEANAAYIAAANPKAILALIAKLEDAQGEIRALRCTEAGLLSELQTLREERTAWRVTAENAEAAVKRARIDALEEARKAVSLEEIFDPKDNDDDSYNCGVLDCVLAIELLKEAP